MEEGMVVAAVRMAESADSEALVAAPTEAGGVMAVEEKVAWAVREAGMVRVAGTEAVVAVAWVAVARARAEAARATEAVKGAMRAETAVVGTLVVAKDQVRRAAQLEVAQGRDSRP